MATPVRFVQTPALALYTPMASTDTSMIVAPYPVDLDGVKLTMTDFGTVAYMTIDPKVSGYEEICSFTGITDNGNNTATLTGLTRDLQSKSPYTGSGTGKTHGSSAVIVFSDNPQVYAQFGALANDNTWTGQQTFTSFPITPSTPLASATVIGMSKLSVAPANALQPIAVGVNDTSTFALFGTGVPTGVTLAYEGIATPSGYLRPDGSAVSRSTYAALFAALSLSQAFTVTIASPAVFTSNAHGLVAGNRIYFTTTSALPSGLSVNTLYYVIATGLTTNAFEVSLTPGGAAINTTGTQAGVHTLWFLPHGVGDFSTTFNLPDRRDRTLVGSTSVAPTKVATIASITGNVLTLTGLSVAANNEFQTGQAVLYTAVVPGNLTTATTYYVVRLSNSTISLATTIANALLATPTVITLAGTETGTFTLTLTVRNLGDTGGEEFHAQNVNELTSHAHTPAQANTASNGSPGGTVGVNNAPGGATGGNTPAPIMQPFGVVNFITKT